MPEGFWAKSCSCCRELYQKQKEDLLVFLLYGNLNGNSDGWLASLAWSPWFLLMQMKARLLPSRILGVPSWILPNLSSSQPKIDAAQRSVCSFFRRCAMSVQCSGEVCCDSQWCQLLDLQHLFWILSFFFQPDYFLATLCFMRTALSFSITKHSPVYARDQVQDCFVWVCARSMLWTFLWVGNSAFRVV